MRRLILAASIALVLASCTTFTSTEGPEWTREVPHPAGYEVFVGSGVGADEQEARAASYRNALEQVGAALGYDAVSPYYREMLSLDRIAALDASVTSTYASPDDEGVAYFAMLQIPEERFLESISEEYSEAIERTGEIGNLLSQAMDSYRANEDTRTLELVLEALDLSLSGTVNDESYTPEQLLGLAMRYLGSIGIEVGDADGTTIPLRLKRLVGFFHPNVVNGLVRAQYTMVSGDGDLLDAYVILRTDRRGRTEYARTNPYMIRKGTVRFSVNVPDDLVESIVSKAPEGFFDPFLDLLEECTVEAAYEAGDRLGAATAVIAVAEYGYDGLQLAQTSCVDAFSAYLAAAGAEGLEIVRGSGEEETDVLEWLRSQHPGMESYILLRAGITDSVSGNGRDHARSEAMLSIYPGDGDEPVLTRSVYAVGAGSDPSEATEASLERAGEAAAGMLLSEL